MGEVYRAQDARLGRDVALKILPDIMARDPDALARFEREARAVAALNHPHIVTIYSTEEHAGVRFLTMEVVEGQTLDRLIPAGGIALDRFFDIAIALADALAAAHQKQITHRDLKPSNVMVTDDGRGDQAFVEARAQRQVDIEGARILERTVEVAQAWVGCHPAEPKYDHTYSHIIFDMATAERVTVTLRADLLEQIDRVERNRSRFIAQAVEHELDRRRREAFLDSVAAPHPESVELADAPLGDWVSDLPADEELVDRTGGTAVRWVEGKGWLTEP